MLIYSIHLLHYIKIIRYNQCIININKLKITYLYSFEKYTI